MKTSKIISLVIMGGLLLFGLVCAMVGLNVWGATQGWAKGLLLPPGTPESAPVGETEALVDAQVEYYRAVYDACMYSAGQAGIGHDTAIQACQQFVRRSMIGKWFEGPSPGWEWPVPKDQPGNGA